MIAVTFALPAESSDFIRLLTAPRIVSRAGVEATAGEFHGRSVAVVHTGVGEEACRPTIENFLRRQPLEYLISAGFAGALDPELHVADLLMAKNYSTSTLLQTLHLHIDESVIRVAQLVTTSSVVSSGDERAQLAKRSGAAAVDMETEFIAAACAAHGVPMISLRAISDTFDEPFPAPPDVLFDVNEQKTKFGRLALYLATHPTAIGRLRTFASRIATARAALTDAVASLVRDLR